jgi:hypothetical protein
MYINRKDGTLVEAEKYYSIGLKRDGWIVKTDNNTLYIPAKDFQGQYGEAMICPLRKDCPVECIRKHPHPKSSLCSVQGCYGGSCIPYIPEHKKSGWSFTKFATKDKCAIPTDVCADDCPACISEQEERQSNLSELMLPKSELDDILQTGGTNRDYFEEIQVALLNHLAKSEFNLYRYQGADIYIPLSDYLKEGE